MHDDQITVAAGTVRALIADQFPAWAALPLRPVTAAGTVNAIFRLGDRLTVRFPLRPGDPAEVRRRLADEAGAARRLATATRFATPSPVAVGEPGHGYPLPWSVQTWLPGDTATTRDPAASDDFARDLAEFVAGVRDLPTGGRRFRGSGRGGVLAGHDAWVRTCLRESEGLLDVARLREIWAAMRDLPRGDTPDVMNHTDLIPGNVVVTADLRLAGVLDVGDLAPADPALDLVGAWHLLDDGPRRVFRAALGCDDAEWARGRAWAFQQAVGAGWYYVRTNPPMSRMGLRTLARISAGYP